MTELGPGDRYNPLCCPYATSGSAGGASPPCHDVEARLNPWLLALIFPIAGFVCGVLVAGLIRLGGAPGAALARRLGGVRATPAAFRGSVVAIAVGQLVVSLLWVVVLYLSVAHLLAGQNGVGRYVAWLLALCSAAVPAQTVTSLFALSGAEEVATTVTLRVTVLVAVVLLFVPGRLERTWGWLPSLHSVSTTPPTDPPHPLPP